jgi:hypothetical protein
MNMFVCEIGGNQGCICWKHRRPELPVQAAEREENYEEFVTQKPTSR